ncbi:hypothetical protein [Leptospira kanakyensis]|uniref:hypothetical protein n=1 Tax=Leptospira kanakyensis TaxID=2484968 RepID=UPI00223D72A9|nr:hypothetical protein [Leptospira kanakyensis]MCW7469553.1 hypothetical protein [Leptospira kanakyensis]
MSHKILITVLWITILSTNSLFAKEFDSTHELPKVITPDKHRVFIRGVDGSGGLRFPVMDYLKYEPINYMLVNGFDEYAALNAFSKQKDQTSGSRQYELEYRYLDKFRLIYENRRLVNVPTSDNDSEGFRFKESYKGFGAGYFHPLSPNFNLGVSLRRVSLDQATTIGTVTFNFLPTNSGVGIMGRDFAMQAKGYVPGIHLEFKPMRWFEIHLGNQFYNLVGDDTKVRVDSVPFTFRNVTTNVMFYELANGNVNYTGEKTTLDFIFRFSSWFATRWGYSVEKYRVKYNNYFIFLGDIDSSVVYSALEGSQKQKMEYSSLNITVEFSKSFGE